jgi:DNA-binding NarL/FixJ family response regulator
MRLLLAHDHTLLRAGVGRLTRELRPGVTVVDLSTPEMHGVEATRAILEEDPGARILVLALSSEEDDELLEGMLVRAFGRLEAPLRVARLTARERDVLRLIAEGHANSAIAAQLTISATTVKTHVAHLFDKLGVDNRVQAAVFAVRHGIA